MGWEIQSSNPGGGTRFISSPKQPDLLLDPPRLLFNGYRGIIPGDQAAGT